MMFVQPRFLLYATIFVAFSLAGLGYLRWEYRQRGKLSPLGCLLHVAIFIVNGIFIGSLLWGETPGIPSMGRLNGLGTALMILGLGIVLYAMDLLHTFSRWLGNKTPGLATNGLYRWSRNPQFLGYGLLVLGACLAWWHRLAWVALLSYVVIAYAVILIEEEHLKRVYGHAYEAYCRRVPRYFGIPKG